MSDIAADVRNILVLHLGAEEARLGDDARLAEELGADRLDLVEIAMSCEERFGIDIPNRVATRFATVGEVVRFVEAQLALTAAARPARRRARLRRGRLFEAVLRAWRDVFARPSSTASSP